MSDLMKLSFALAVLRQDKREVIRHDGLEKSSGVLSTVKDVAKAIKGGAVHGAEKLDAQGYKNLSKALKYAPEAALTYGGYRAYESPTGQKLRYKYQLWKARRQQRQQMGY